VRRLVGLVSDETSESQSTWTAREYLSYFARIRHLPDPGDHVEQLLDGVGLDAHFRDKCIGTYSTGMKRRVEIARALMGVRRCCFWTRPPAGSACQPSATCGICCALVAATENVTTFLSSHDSHEIRSLCNEISVIAKG
jgi:ABC-type multidrug transport system ATPase subunit